MFDNRPHDWVFDAHRPAGWYPDPAGTDRWEYWNGRAWVSQLDATKSPTAFMTRHPLLVALITALTIICIGMLAFATSTATHVLLPAEWQ